MNGNLGVTKNTEEVRDLTMGLVFILYVYITQMPFPTVFFIRSPGGGKC